MRYIVDSNNNVKEVSFGYTFTCNGVECVEYEGNIPTGYTSLEEWFAAEGDKLWRWQISSGNLVLNSSADEPEADKCVPRTAADVGAVPTTGGTLTGDLSISKTDDSTVKYGLGNSLRKVYFQQSSSDNAGIYDSTNSKWLFGYFGDANRLGTGINPPPDQWSMRMLKAGTTDLTAGTTSLVVGHMYAVYE